MLFWSLFGLGFFVTERELEKGNLDHISIFNDEKGEMIDRNDEQFNLYIFGGRCTESSII